MDKCKNIISLIRPKQWIKNFFVFAAILFSNNFANLLMLKQSCIAFVAFCLISSSIYILNDIIDMENDKKHPEKRNRPIASGKITLVHSIIIGITLGLISLSIAIMLSKYLFVIILLYIINNLVYSFKIKRIVLLDAFSIAIGFILRVLAGAVVIQVTTSSWIILCTLFLSIFLALGKRRSEILLLGDSAVLHRNNLAQYTVQLLDHMINIVLSCTIVFYALYCAIGSSTSNFIFTTILVLFGILRYYYLIYSQNEGGSPTDLVLKDKQLTCCIALWIISCTILLNLDWFHFNIFN
jgi:4-hydroxybenzoate polyprenyltransferase